MESSWAWIVAAEHASERSLTTRFFLIDNDLGATTPRDLDMGAMADAIVAYMQPLIDQTDGSQEQLDRACAIGLACYNLALSPEDSREEVIGKMQSSFKMDDEEFADFRRSIIDPMIRRHHEMFPSLHQRLSSGASRIQPSMLAPSRKPSAGDPYPGTGRYAPCPCGSGEKYKFCCGKKNR